MIGRRLRSKGKRPGVRPEGSLVAKPMGKGTDGSVEKGRKRERNPFGKERLKGKTDGVGGEEEKQERSPPEDDVAKGEEGETQTRRGFDVSRSFQRRWKGDRPEIWVPRRAMLGFGPSDLET